MKYIKTIDGTVVIKPRHLISINKNGMITYNPTHEHIINDGWSVYEEPEIPEETIKLQELISARLHKRNEILMYDKSKDVELFSIGENSLWLDLNKRAGLLLRFQAEQSTGKTITTLWDNDKQYTLPIDTAIQMLYILEVYASQCYDTTQQHLAQLNALKTIEEIEAYDYTAGYPEKLKF